MKEGFKYYALGISALLLLGLIVVTPSDGDNRRGVGALGRLQESVVQVEATGSFVYSESGMLHNGGFTGSGFFVDESGLVVTNNHTVSGAETLQVFVSGETYPRVANILGVSECADLAVIDVEGDGFTYLPWYDDDVTVGTVVYAAGFPLRDGEYALLNGVVSKERADGATSWLSVDSVIEHTVKMLAGSSGGPLVSETGRVIGINYGGDESGHAFAIGYVEAMRVIDLLVKGINVDSIGINGEVLTVGEVSGIWVYSVISGSPADILGVEGGDIITKIAGIIAGSDGTMASYCDVLRGKSDGDPIQLEVWRDSLGEYLEGALNTENVFVTEGHSTTSTLP